MANSIGNVIIEITKYLCYNIQNLLKGHLQTCSIILLTMLSLEDKYASIECLEKHSKKECELLWTFIIDKMFFA